MNDVDARTVRFGVAGLVVLAILVFVGITVFGGDDDDSNDSGAVGLSQSELIDEAANLKHVAYWVGPQEDVDQYELSQTEDGANIYVRYLTGGAEVGNTDPDYLTVGTYLVQDAQAALRRSAAGGPNKVVEKDGYSVLEGTGTNAYVVFDDQPDLQVEIFSADPNEAVDLANSGALIPLG